MDTGRAPKERETQDHMEKDSGEEPDGDMILRPYVTLGTKKKGDGEFISIVI